MKPMKPWLARLGVIGTSLLLVIGGIPQQAHARTTFVVLYRATMTLSGGMGYMLMTLGPQTPSFSCLPLPTATTPNCHPVYDHQRALEYSQSTLPASCRDDFTHANKAGKAPKQTGDCTFGGSGEITGHCGLNGGQITLVLTNSAGQLYSLSLHFTEAGGKVAFTGHWSKPGTGQQGKVLGSAKNIVNPLQGGSCTNKTARTFEVVDGTLTGTAA